MLQIAEALQYLHERDIVHGDIQWVSCAQTSKEHRPLVTDRFARCFSQT